MVANLSKPVVGDSYIEVLQFIRDNFDALAKLDPSLGLNFPSGAKRYNETTKYFEKFNGASWVNLIQTLAQLASGGAVGDLIQLGADETWERKTLAEVFPLTSWVPSYGAQSPMTFTVTATHSARYLLLGDLVLFHTNFRGNTGGSAATYITQSIPFSAASTTDNPVIAVGFGDVASNISLDAIQGVLLDANTMAIRKEGGVTYGAPSSTRNYSLIGLYERA